MLKILTGNGSMTSLETLLLIHQNFAKDILHKWRYNLKKEIMIHMQLWGNLQVVIILLQIKT